MGSIFGGSHNSSASQSQSQQQSQNSSQSGNLAYPGLSTALNPQVNTGVQANTGLGSLLGVGGDPAAQQAAFNNYKNSTGYQFQLDQGNQAVTDSAASKGLLDSGATGKSLEAYGQNLGNTTFNNYLDQLRGLSNSGTTAAGVIGSAGQQSSSQGTSSGSSTSVGTSNGSSKPGISGLIGSGLSAIGASDVRVKRDIEKVGEYKGLNVYKFKYKEGFGPNLNKEYIPNDNEYIGVMADEVRDLYPEALGPEINGYMTVNYGAL